MPADVPLSDIPLSVDNAAGLPLLDYLVPLYVVSPRGPGVPLKLIGSGTLVEIAGSHHILTAAHVWHQARDADDIGLVLTTAYPSAFTMPRDTVEAKVQWNRESPECWGPDLALLQIAPPFVARIAAHKSFVNLTRHRGTLSSYPPAIEKGYWAITGMVGELSDVHAQPLIGADVQARAFFSGVRQTHERDGYDYFDLGAKPNLAGVRSFGGVSGGALWEVGLSMAKSGEISWNGRRHFRGVAFWQEQVSDDRLLIRCHGPQSVFQRAWDAWGLPAG